MTLKQYFETIDRDEIDRFIAEGQEENLSLEFKTVNHPVYNEKNKEFDRKNLSEALSGFANSNGGIVVWGIKANKDSNGRDVASSVAPIKELTKFLNLLNRNEGQAVIPVITGVVHEKIDLGEDTAYVKSFIPSSSAAPHMALFSGKHYYKRSGDSFYQCEHYDIVDMFSRKTSPDLELVTRILKRTLSSNNKIFYVIMVAIHNRGRAIAKYPYLAIDCNHDYRASEYGLDGNKTCGLHKVSNNTLYRFNYSGGSEIVIYPDAILEVDKFVTEISVNDVPRNFEYNYILAAEGMTSISDHNVIDLRTIMVQSIGPGG